MTKLGRLNKLDEAASWLAEKLEDTGFTPGHLIELGIHGSLKIHVGIPMDALKLPEGVRAPGLKHTPFLDGIVELNALDCIRIQALGYVTTTEVDFNDFSYPLNREITITPDMLRIKRELLEAYEHKVANTTTSIESENFKPISTVADHADNPPGKLPNTSVGRLAIKAAWQIECETHRAASRDDVMVRLQKWADDGCELEVLVRSNKPKRGVEWQTKDAKSKLYDIQACGKTLQTWTKSRA